MQIKRINDYKVSDYTDKTELKNVCTDIRENIIEFTANNGGYLSSNLSCVEIALSLSLSFDSNDRIFYCGEDLSLTNEIFTNNSLNNRYSLSSCLSEAVSRDLSHKSYNVVSVINSEYLRSGKAIEALNQIGAERRKMIIVFNDDTTINQGIGLVDRFVSTLRNTKAYNNIKTNVKTAISSNKNGDKLIEDIHNFKSSIKKSMIHEGIFGEYDIEYIGPVDGHNLNDLSRAFEVVKSKEYPVVVHCISTNGKGFKLAESNTNGAWNKVDKFNAANGKAYAGEVDNYLFPKHIIANELNKSMMTNENIVILSNNIHEDGVSLLFGQYINRCINVSSNAISLEMAAGLSRCDKYSYTCLMSSELNSCYEQFTNFICKENKPILIGVIDDDNDQKYLNSLNNVNVVEGNDYETIAKTVHGFVKSDKAIVIVLPKTCIECK